MHSYGSLSTNMQIYPKAKTFRPEDFVDLSFVRELDQSGFINNLYR